MPANEQGASPDRYMVIPRTLIFIRRGEAVLLIRGGPHKRLWANRYNGIGGHLEPGEDVVSGARRELAEETGLQVQPLFLCGIVMVQTGSNPGVVLFIFTGESVEGELNPSPEGSLEWVSPEALPGVPVVEDLPVLLGKTLAWRPGDPPFYAVSHYNPLGELVVKFDA